MRTFNTDAAAAAVLLLPLLAASCVGGGVGSSDQQQSPSASCADVIDFQGQRYVGHGELARVPQTTGHTETGIAPACDDGGGAVSQRRVEVRELEDVPMNRAVLADGRLYVKMHDTLPEVVRSWLVAPTCDTPGSFTLTGTWTGVTAKVQPKVDGGIRPPYRVRVRITEGPQRYVGSLLMLNATGETDPVLGRRDVTSSLWRGGNVNATVHCDGDTFVADELTSTPGARQW
jgi:hypothetical protein